MRKAMGVPRRASVESTESEIGRAGGTHDSDDALDYPRVSGMAEVASSADGYLEEDLLTALTQVSTRQIKRPLPRPAAASSANSETSTVK